MKVPKLVKYALGTPDLMGYNNKFNGQDFSIKLTFQIHQGEKLLFSEN